MAACGRFALYLCLDEGGTNEADILILQQP